MREKTKYSRSPLYLGLPFIIILVMVMVLAACGQTNTSQDSAAPSGTSSGSDVVADSTSAPTVTESSEVEATPKEQMPEPTATTEQIAPVEGGVSYGADVSQIIQSRCINCHGGEKIEGELVMLSYEDLMKGGESGQVIVAGDAANSLLVQLITEMEMPKRGPKLTPVQIQLITDWVNQGALNN
ncbi:MAG: hypothetical protein P8Y72_14810 [Anaerolineales bacterium]